MGRSSYAWMGDRLDVPTCIVATLDDGTTEHIPLFRNTCHDGTRYTAVGRRSDHT